MFTKATAIAIAICMAATAAPINTADARDGERTDFFKEIQKKKAKKDRPAKPTLRQGLLDQLLVDDNRPRKRSSEHKPLTIQNDR